MNTLKLIDGVAKDGDTVMWANKIWGKIRVQENIVFDINDEDVHIHGTYVVTPSFLTLEGLKKYCKENGIKVNYNDVTVF